MLENLKPFEVHKYFEEICKIPHGSSNEKALSDYIVNFAKENGLDVWQDSEYNVIVKKPGTKGYENSAPVIIQSHLDMVNEKNNDTVHDFLVDGLKLRIDGDYICTYGTTLGADDGIGVAYTIAVLESKDIPHPPIEAVFTTNEETGMDGAKALDASLLEGKRLINVDSEEEGIVYVSCAGGMRIDFSVPVIWEEAKESEFSETYEITIKGLKGGHSGIEIDKGRGNAVKLMGRLLNIIKASVEYRVAGITGGGKDNAIPRECVCTLSLKSGSAEKVADIISCYEKILQNEFRITDPLVIVEFAKNANCPAKKYFSDTTTAKLVSALMQLPNGIQTMSFDIEGLPESSTNIGVLKTNEYAVIISNALRSSITSRKEYIRDQIENLADILGCGIVKNSEYPAWEYNPDSPLRTAFVDVYERMFGSKPETKAIHAGLECGLLAEKIPGLDMVSFGPNVYNAHSPEEKLSISSTARMWDYFLEILKQLK